MQMLFSRFTCTPHDEYSLTIITSNRSISGVCTILSINRKAWGIFGKKSYLKNVFKLDIQILEREPDVWAVLARRRQELRVTLKRSFGRWKIGQQPVDNLRQVLRSKFTTQELEWLEICSQCDSRLLLLTIIAPGSIFYHRLRFWNHNKGTLLVKY